MRHGSGMSRTLARALHGMARIASSALKPERQASTLALLHEATLQAVAVPTSAGVLRMLCPSNRALHDPYGFGRDEPETVAWIESLPADAVLWDIGANIGLYALFAAKRGLRVLAFEPSAQSFAAMVRSAEANGLDRRIDAFCLALGEGMGSIARLEMASSEAASPRRCRRSRSMASSRVLAPPRPAISSSMWTASSLPFCAARRPHWRSMCARCWWKSRARRQRPFPAISPGWALPRCRAVGGTGCSAGGDQPWPGTDSMVSAGSSSCLSQAARQAASTWLRGMLWLAWRSATRRAARVSRPSGSSRACGGSRAFKAAITPFFSVKAAALPCACMMD
ncbi:MAG: FkbM family methyltransferase [Rhodospirillales bacterium]|nr:FkbM family methyltransferase [Rhodospirillales bacterium]